MAKYLKIFCLSMLVLLVASGCNNNKPKNYTSYFGGQIVNPKSPKIYLLKNDKYIDSTTLNSHNKFLFKLKNLKPGLYSFSHGTEYQYVYFAAADSIIIRLNTWDFDESLVFSGKGAQRNNFLMNLFLNNENEDKAFEAYYTLPAKAFNQKFDSVLKVKLNLYNQFKVNTKNQPEAFDKLVKVAINYPLYRKKEIYPMMYKRNLNLDSYPVIDSSFYQYRSHIDLNDSSLVYFYPYRNYINSFLHHNAYEKKYYHPETNVGINILENIISSIHQKNLRNFFLYRIMSDSFFYYNLSDNDRKIALELFYKNCDDPKLVSEIKLLAHDFKSIKTGSKLLNFELVNTKGKKINITSVTKNKKSVIYFWSEKLINANNLSKRILYLEKSYPNLNFIGVNIDNSKDLWMNSGIFNTLSPKNQYKLTQKCVMRKFITSRTPRIILLDKNNIVKNGFTVIWAENFNNQLQSLNKN